MEQSPIDRGFNDKTANKTNRLEKKNHSMTHFSRIGNRKRAEKSLLSVGFSV